MKIFFNVSGYVIQTIVALNGEDVETIVKKLRTGEYATTLKGGLSFIENTMNEEAIARIEDIDNNLSYDDFEFEEL